MFVLLMTLKIDLEKEYITHDEFQNFIKGGAALDLNTCPPKPAKWITDLTWMNLVELSKLRHFQYIVQQVTNNDKAWKSWFDKDAPEESYMPEGYNNLDTFRKLLMIRCQRMIVLILIYIGIITELGVPIVQSRKVGNIFLLQWEHVMQNQLYLIWKLCTSKVDR